MARLLVVLLFALGCSSTPDVTNIYVLPSAGSAGAESGGSSAGGTSTTAAGGGTGGTTTPGGSAGETHTTAGGSAGGVDGIYTPGGSGGQPAAAGAGGVGGTEPNPYPSCGDGVCLYNDYAIVSGAFVRPDTPACNADCPQTCGNGKCDVNQDSWNGCTQECVVEPPKPIVLCPFPAWESPYPADFVNPYHPKVQHAKWMLGDRVDRDGRCYRCNDTECQEAPPSLIMGEPWSPISCNC